MSRDFSKFTGLCTKKVFPGCGAITLRVRALVIITTNPVTILG